MPAGCRRGAHSGPPGAGWPGAKPGTLHLPAMPAQPGAGVHPTPGDPGSDASPPQQPPAAPIVIALIAMQLGRASARPTRSSPRPEDRRHGVHQRLQQLRILGVGRRQPHHQRQAGGVDQQVVLGASLAPIDRIRAGQLPPRRACTSRCRWPLGTSRPGRRRLASPAADGARPPTPRRLGVHPPLMRIRREVGVVCRHLSRFGSFLDTVALGD
jgi:hypothetical protein